MIKENVRQVIGSELFLSLNAQMQIIRQVAGEVFDAALSIASDQDKDLRVNEVRGAFPLIKEDTWQEVSSDTSP